MKLSYLLFTSLLCLVLASCATPPEPQSLLAIGQATTDWYADPAGKLFVEPETVELAQDELKSVEVQVRDQDFIYKTGYVWDGDEWNVITFDSDTKINDQWLADEAFTSIGIDLAFYKPDTYFVAAYSCNLVNRAFDCNGGKWMLKEFVVEEKEILPPPVCPINYDPVCGVDGVTYGNACQADVTGVAIDYEGDCETDTPSQRITDFVEKPTEYVIGSSKDLVIEIGDDHPNIDAAVFQVYHLDDAEVQADIYDSSAPFIYPGSVLDTTNAGRGSVQVFLKENGNNVKVIKFTVNFVTGDGPICGNGVIESGEFCDGDSQTCSLNGQSGTQTCNSQCTGYNTCQITQQSYACSDGLDNDGDGKIDMQDPGCSSSTDNDEYNYVSTGGDKVLTPGNGWSSETTVPSNVGSSSVIGYDKRPITRWDVVPHQTFDGLLEVGLLAFHANGFGYNGEGINYVEFAVDGGPWLRVNEASLNPRTQVNEWWVTLDAGKFSRDKQVEVRAKIYPVHGKPRVMKFNELYANARGSYNRQPMVLPAGTHTINADTINDLPDTGYYTIRGADGTSRQDVKVKVNGEITAKGNLKFEGVTIIAPDYYPRAAKSLVNAEQGVVFWFDDVYAHGPLTDTADTSGHVNHVTFYGVVYATNMKISHLQVPFYQWSPFFRNVHVFDYYEDGIRDARLVVNSLFEGQDRGGTDMHPALFSMTSDFSGGHNDVIFYDVESRDMQGAGFAGANLFNAAFINLDIRDGNKVFFMSGTHEHTFFKDSTIGPTSFRYNRNGRPLFLDTVVYDNTNVAIWKDSRGWVYTCPEIHISSIRGLNGQVTIGGVGVEFKQPVVFRNGGSCPDTE